MANTIYARVFDDCILCAISSCVYENEDYDERIFWERYSNEREELIPLKLKILGGRTLKIRQCPSWLSEELLSLGQPSCKFRSGEDALEAVLLSGIRMRYI